MAPLSSLSSPCGQGQGQLCRRPVASSAACPLTLRFCSLEAPGGNACLGARYAQPLPACQAAQATPPPSPVTLQPPGLCSFGTLGPALTVSSESVRSNV